MKSISIIAVLLALIALVASDERDVFRRILPEIRSKEPYANAVSSKATTPASSKSQAPRYLQGSLTTEAPTPASTMAPTTSTRSTPAASSGTVSISFDNEIILVLVVLGLSFMCCLCIGIVALA